ncbi:MAG: redoxin domain-containing protein [Anaerolineaceae bacterium]|nr:redoxin domain-containing protein [Anaerolineaceae bacterium]MBN2677328.1 redoxin domain-containing protein [Anaerolineaceae bacterium]
MAQLRQDYSKFKDLNTEILVMVPNGPRMIERYLKSNPTPYPILTDKGAKVAGQYLQIKQFFSLGTPSVFLVDKAGKIRYVFYGKLMIDEPDNREALGVLTGMA